MGEKSGGGGGPGCFVSIAFAGLMVGALLWAGFGYDPKEAVVYGLAGGVGIVCGIPLAIVLAVVLGVGVFLGIAALRDRMARR